MSDNAEKPPERVWRQKGLRGDLGAIRIGYRGLWALIRRERPIWLQLSLAIVFAAGGWWRGFGLISWLVFIFGVGLVVYAEMANTVAEKICNRITLEADPGIKDIKDISAGAVSWLCHIAILAYIILMIHPL